MELLSGFKVSVDGHALAFIEDQQAPTYIHNSVVVNGSEVVVRWEEIICFAIFLNGLIQALRLWWGKAGGNAIKRWKMSSTVLTWNYIVWQNQTILQKLDNNLFMFCKMGL